MEENCSNFLPIALWRHIFPLHIEHGSCSKFCCRGGHCTQWMLARYHLLPRTLLQWMSRICCSPSLLRHLNTSGVWRVHAIAVKNVETIITHIRWRVAILIEYRNKCTVVINDETVYVVDSKACMPIISGSRCNLSCTEHLSFKEGNCQLEHMTSERALNQLVQKLTPKIAVTWCGARSRVYRLSWPDSPF